MSVSKTILVGNLGRDPEVRYRKDGGAICSFSMATTEKWKNKSGERQEKTSWHRITIFGKLGEIAAQYLSRGSQVYIEGRLEYGEYENKEGVTIPTTQIIASIMTMLGQAGGGDRSSSSGSGQFEDNKAGSSASSGGDDFESDDIPF